MMRAPSSPFRPHPALLEPSSSGQGGVRCRPAQIAQLQHWQQSTRDLGQFAVEPAPDYVALNMLMWMVLVAHVAEQAADPAVLFPPQEKVGW